MTDEYEMVMPFVTTQDNGGPRDSEMCDNYGAAGRCYRHLGPGLTPSRKGLAMEATRMCAAPQCNEVVSKLGLCGRHYLRQYRTGSVANGLEPLASDDLPGEQWVPVPGYEGIYEVSDHGRVKSVARTSRRKDSAKLVRFPERMLRLSNERYPAVQLCRDGKPKRFRVHVLVLTAFVGHCPKGMECLHADDNGHNNHLSNLRWGTPSQNQDDRWGHHRRRDGNGYKLTSDEAREILAAARAGERHQDIAARYGISRTNVGHIARAATWPHLQGKPSMRTKPQQPTVMAPFPGSAA